MSFVDLLKQSRSRPVSVFHKFLLSYEPNGVRTHAFVEGNPDLAYYRNYLELYVETGTLHMYNCEGKANVYETFGKVMERFPRCRRVVFFVDKDIDDVLGVPSPTDPRIFVTEFYSVENYLVCKEVVRRFFLDFVKLKKVEFDLELALPEFDRQLKQFHRIILPIMAWIVNTRRSGERPVLNDVNLGEFWTFRDFRVVRRGGSRLVEYLERVTKVNCRTGEWKQTRQTCRELIRLESKRYVRGKFEAWFLLNFMRQMIEKLSAMARESGGTVSISVQASESNFIQLLVRALPPPQPLSSFLDFHLKSEPARVTQSEVWETIRSWLRKAGLPFF